uniref:Uncharacterized protein n=1 Tax=Chromera velia CCMP2878 TaxID=1169474 RepID=A0A0G4GXF1_9ALVE|eukprot:Cvel_23802.t1-p1 / transcript=Cvel_23802.t1 / gene=Cvel_23802 / organism=Chromera_velia_CCMP2878 / gene_product=ALA-interacting subunit 1, putative / transcript_product=ALA-interacting subunit 1, putative / location=Cvel_scaffold2499:2497-6511(-) / protein_length=369 / sequence_SO=supercontig / SO=protein_coding / is_pseudo=false
MQRGGVEEGGPGRHPPQPRHHVHDPPGPHNAVSGREARSNGWALLREKTVVKGHKCFREVTENRRCALLLFDYGRYIKCEVDYGSGTLGVNQTVTITQKNCTGNLGDREQPLGEYFLYYELLEFYQNNRRYIASRSDDQLQGAAMDRGEWTDIAAACKPVACTNFNASLTAEAGEGGVCTGDTPYFIVPCGQMAATIFTDRFWLHAQTDEGVWVEKGVDTEPETIAWNADVERMENPPMPQGECMHGVCFRLNKTLFPLGLKDGHFLVWMRPAPMPDSWKLWGKIEGDLTFPVNVTVENNYDAGVFGATKKLIIAENTLVGGGNQWMATAFLISGTIEIIFALVVLLISLGKANRQKRHLQHSPTNLHW